LEPGKIDHGREFDWGKTSADYSAYRMEYPKSLFDALLALGIGLPGQRILDLGTGTGALARGLAARGAQVTGVDVSPNQIAEAKELAEQQKLEVDFSIAAAEEIDFADSSFDIVTVAQAWIYFDAARVIPKILRVLTRDGCLVVTLVNWLPYKDEIARAMEELVLKYNPQWTGGGYKGDPPKYNSLKEAFDLKTLRLMDEAIPFSRDSWRGRIRACRGVGAALPPEAIAGFDAEHKKLLEKMPESFSVLHQIAVHVFVRKE
jgi:ubiquinone/menaquinone biosynthesis C-methylase UbiE